MFLVINLVLLSKFFNYIDPGSGSVIITMIIGALVGVGITIRMYWEKLKYRLSSHNRNNAKSNDKP